MSDSAIPKEQMTAYERWELPNFGHDSTSGVAHYSASSHLHGGHKAVAAVLPTAAQVANIQQQAHDEGYAAGAQLAAEEARRMAGLADSMGQAFQQLDQQVAQEVLTLALEVARQMLQQALRVNPELLLSVINSAITSLPHFNQGAHKNGRATCTRWLEDF
jgi:flagellar assembly protein FliH